jgi:hypothetical protein
MSKHIRKHRWIVGLIILSLLVFTTVLLAQKWAQTTQSNTTENLNGVWITATKNTDDPTHPSLKIYSVGNNGAIIYSENGTFWSAQTSGTANNLNAIWGSSATDIFAVGISGTIVHSANGTDWTLQRSGGNDLNAVWGSSATDVFAVGNIGTILHSDDHGSSWDSQTSGTTYNLNAVWGSSPTDVYAVGDHRTVLHYNGTAWTNQSSPALDNLKGIWGTSFCNIYSVGATGSGGAVMYHFDGSTWSSQDVGGSPYALNAVHGASIRDIFAMGNNGFVMKFDPEDSTAPSVYSSRPGLYDSDIPLNTTVSATFNAVMDPDTINTDTFTLVYYENQEAHQVTGTVSYSNNTATFIPSSDLSTAVTYTATLKAPDAEKGITGAKDNLGVPLSADYSWSFTPGSDPESDGGGGGSCFIAVSQPAR